MKRTKMKVMLSILMIICISMLGVGCGSGASAGDPTVVATVNSIEITQGDVDSYYALMVQGSDMTDVDEATIADLKNTSLEDCVMQELLKQNYESNTENVIPETMEDDYKETLTNIKANADMSQYLKDNNISDSFIEKVYYANFYSQYIQENVSGNITDEQVQEYYNANPEEFNKKEIRASHILVTEQALAEDLKEQLNNGADFAELAREHGTDGTKDSGGDLGFFAQDGSMVQEFEVAAFALTEIGQVSDLVETQFGFHLIKLTDVNEDGQSLESVESEIRTILIGEAYNAEIERLMSAADIVYIDNDDAQNDDTQNDDTQNDDIQNDDTDDTDNVE